MNQQRRKRNWVGDSTAESANRGSAGCVRAAKPQRPQEQFDEVRPHPLNAERYAAPCPPAVWLGEAECS